MTIAPNTENSKKIHELERLLLSHKFLTTEHLKDLEASGISQEAAMAAGINSVAPDSIGKVLGACGFGWAAAKVDSILAFPYPSLNGSGDVVTWRFKLFPAIETKDGKSAKYLSPEGSSPRLYLPLGLDPKDKYALYLTEGEKKAQSLTLAGYSALGLPGVWGWKQDGKPIPDLDSINCKKRDIIVVFDADTVVNEHVQQAEAQLADELTKRKARVFIVRLPFGPGCPKGVDDFLVQHGEEKFEKLPRKPFKPKKCKQPPPAPAIEGDGGLYAVENDCFLLRRHTREGEILTLLTNFVAQIKASLCLDDGVERKTVFVLEGRLSGGGPLPELSIPVSQFASMTWHHQWGAKAMLMAGFNNKDHTRVAIQLASKSTVREITAYIHSGWRTIEGELVFLHSGGAIGKDGAVSGVEVRADKNLEALILPEPPQGDDDLKRVLRVSLDLANLGPSKVMMPLLAAVYTAPLAHFGIVDFNIHLAGQTGVFKTELTALCMGHYGTGFSGRCLPATWESTANSLEKLCHLAKDVLLVIDDFAPRGGAIEGRKLHAKADRVLRAQGNQAGRGRMAADGSLRTGYAPRGLILSTGEDLPAGHSLRARGLVIEVGAGDVKADALTKAQEAAAEGRYAQAMAAYLQHLAGRHEDLGKNLKNYRRQAATKLRQHLPDAHGRTLDSCASLLIGATTFLGFATKAGAITEEERDKLLLAFREALVEVAREQERFQRSEDPVRRFLDLLQAAFTMGRVHLVHPRDGYKPDDPELWGWKVFYTGAGDEAEKEARPQGDKIGAVDDDGLYLIPDAVFAVVQRLGREQGDLNSLSVTPKTLWKRLADKGLLASKDAGNTTKKSIGGQRLRVLHLLPWALGGENEK